MINIDSTKAFFRNDQRVDAVKAADYEKFGSERKNPHKYPSPKELCVLVETPEGSKYNGWTNSRKEGIIYVWDSIPIFIIKPPFELNDVVCLAGEWVQGKAGTQNILDMLANKYKPEYLKKYGIPIQPFSTMPPHLGKCIQIMGEPRVELVDYVFKYESSFDGPAQVTKKKHHFIYPIKEVESETI